MKKFDERDQLSLFLPSDPPGMDFDTHVGALSEMVFDWAEAAFPDRTDVSLFLKLYSELGEVIESQGAADEIADLFILLLDYAVRKKVDITSAVRKKIIINRARLWCTDQNGVNRHVD